MKKIIFLLISALMLQEAVSQTVQLNIKVFIEGPYLSGQMTPFLNVLGYVPIDQPYNVPPWDYPGTESVDSLPNYNIVDWVLVDLLTPAIQPQSYYFLSRKAAFIMKNGSIKDLDGISNIVFSPVISGEYFICIHHRNHISVLASDPATENAGVYTYDFTTGQDQAFGGNKAQKEISPGIWGMISADGNANGEIDNRDKNDVWLPQYGQVGYLKGDFDLNSQVDIYDKTNRWATNAGKGMTNQQFSVLTNIPPFPPTTPQPDNNAENIGTDTTLSWSCSDPEGNVVTYCIYFGTDPNPQIIESSYSSTVFSLPQLGFNSTYYWKIVAKDIEGDSTSSPVWNFSTIIGFQCGDSILDSRNNQTYRTVQIGIQCWMAENLNVGTRINGILDQTINGTIEKYCYNDLESNCDIYGGLYQWNEMMQYTNTSGSQGICPIGWHLPTDEEWKILEGVVDSQYPIGDPIWNNTGWRGFDAGKNLKSTTGWNSGGSGTDQYGFVGLPGGVRYSESGGFFGQAGNYSYFWSSDENGNSAWYRSLRNSNNNVGRTSYYKTYGRSVRCLKGVTINNQPPDLPSNPFPGNGSVNINIDNQLSWQCGDQDGEIISYSIYFGTEPNPPIIESKYNYRTYNIPNLQFLIQYYWKIVATDSNGDSTSSAIWNFWTFDNNIVIPSLIEHSGQVYNLIQIGTQVWFKENLNIGNIIIGSQNQTNNGIIEKFCYNDNIENCDIYGGLYQWNEMMQYTTTPGSQGICPIGWQIPTDAQWYQLENYLDPTINIPGTSGWRGTDCGTKLQLGGSSGLDLMLSGQRYYNSGTFNYIEERGFFWTSSSGAWYRRLDSANPQVYRSSNSNLGYGFSIRCMKNLGSFIPPNQPGSINGNAFPGCNQSINYSINPVAGATIYNWKIPIDAEILSGQGTTSIMVNLGNISGIISVCAGNEYGYSSYKDLLITIDIPSQPNEIFGEINPECNSTGEIYSINPVPGANNYSWTVPPDAIITAGQGSLAISVNFGNESGIISVNASNTCGNSENTNLQILIQSIPPAQPGNISGIIYPCKLSTKTYSISTVPNTTFYNWTVPNGATILNGQGTTNISVLFGTQSGDISVRAGNGCGVSDPTYLSISVQSGVPNQPGFIIGQSLGCSVWDPFQNDYETYTYSINPVPNAINYVWTVPSFIEISSGQGTTSIEVIYWSSGTGNIIVKAINDCGISIGTSLVVSVATGLPATSSITGLTDVYCFQQGVVYSANPVPGAFSYYWSIFDSYNWNWIQTGLIVSGQGTNNIMVDFESEGYYSLYVQAVDNNGCISTNYNSKDIEVHEVNNYGFPKVVNGPNNVSPYQSGVQFSISLDEPVATVQWEVPPGATITSGDGTTTIQLDFGIEGGFVSARGVSPCGYTVWYRIFVKVLYEGGYVFYTDNSGEHGFIMSPVNQISQSPWGCQGVLITSGNGANGSDLGTGSDNTLAIITDCTTPNIAAQLCNNLVLGNHDDWFLPSENELAEIYNMYQSIYDKDGDMASYNPYNLGGPVWSSTQHNNNSAVCYEFVPLLYGGGGPGPQDKNITNEVIAIRAF